MLPRVSVIIRAFNPDVWILEAIDSVIKQSYEGHIEIVLCWDESSSGRKFLEKISSLVKFLPANRSIKIIVHPPRSPARAWFEYGLRNAEGEYIAGLDADDKYPPEYIAKALSEIKSYDLLCCRIISMDMQGKILGNLYSMKKVGYTRLLLGNIYATSCLFFSKKIKDYLLQYYNKVIKNSRSADLIHEDYLMVLIGFRNFKAKYTHNLYVYYRIHERQQTYPYKGEHWRVVEILLRDIITLFFLIRILGHDINLIDKITIALAILYRVFYALYMYIGTIGTVFGFLGFEILSFTKFVKKHLKNISLKIKRSK